MVVNSAGVIYGRIVGRTAGNAVVRLSLTYMHPHHMVFEKVNQCGIDVSRVSYWTGCWVATCGRRDDSFEVIHCLGFMIATVVGDSDDSQLCRDKK